MFHSVCLSCVNIWPGAGGDASSPWIQVLRWLWMVRQHRFMFLRSQSRSSRRKHRRIRQAIVSAFKLTQLSPHVTYLWFSKFVFGNYYSMITYGIGFEFFVYYDQLGLKSGFYIHIARKRRCCWRKIPSKTGAVFDVSCESNIVHRVNTK